MQLHEYANKNNIRFFHYTRLILQLKIYIQEHSFYPKLVDEDHIPVAANSTTAVEILNNSYYTQVPLSSEQILFICPFFMTVTILALMMIVLMLYACGGICRFKSNAKAGLKNHTKATILAFTIASFNRVLIFLSFDTAAVLEQLTSCNESKARAICEFGSLIYTTPTVLYFFDLAALFVYLIIFFILVFKLRF